eukprot:SAG31_NODE_48_length_30945_cov_16.254263_23_plen_91_part_00
MHIAAGALNGAKMKNAVPKRVLILKQVELLLALLQRIAIRNCISGGVQKPHNQISLVGADSEREGKFAVVAFACSLAVTEALHMVEEGKL